MNRLKWLCMLAMLMCPYGHDVLAQRHATFVKGNLATVGSFPEKVFHSIPITGSMAITPDEKYCFFASRQGGMNWSSSTYSGKIIWDADLYASEQKDSVWAQPINLGKKVNDKNDQGAAAVTVDGQIIYFLDYRDGWKDNGGPIYRATLHGKAWSDATPLGSTISEFFAKNPFCGGITVSPDMKTIVVSAAPTSTGTPHFHLYAFHEIREWRWSLPKLLGTVTDSSEINPHFASDGKTLYFGSNGFAGFGSFDVYKTVLLDDDSCGEIFNLGSSINTREPETDISFNLLGTHAYLKRATDFYRINIDPDFKEVSAMPSVMMTGVVDDSKSGEPVEATLLLRNDSTNYAAISNSTTGSYGIILHPQTQYKLLVTAPGYSPYEEEIFIEDSKSSLLSNNIHLSAVVTVRVAEARTIIGKVKTDESDRSGTVVSIRDTATMQEAATVATDSLGNFQLPLPKGNVSILTMSRQGFIPQSLVITHADTVTTANVGEIELKSLKQLLEAGQSVRLSSIQFNKGEADIRPQSFSDLDRISAAVKEIRAGKIRVSGFTDSVGGEDFNVELSRKRAQAVCRYMIDKGVPKESLESFGFGPKNPIASNDTEEGRQMNRRVEFVRSQDQNFGAVKQ